MHEATFTCTLELVAQSYLSMVGKMQVDGRSLRETLCQIDVLGVSLLGEGANKNKLHMFVRKLKWKGSGRAQKWRPKDSYFILNHS